MNNKDVYELSILIPAIRQNRWPEVYRTLGLACKQYKWELVLVGPFAPTGELAQKENVKHVFETGDVARAVQHGVLECSADLMFITVDDCTFQEDSLDDAMNMYRELCSRKDVICVRYGEGGDKQPEHYWHTSFHGDLRKPGIDPSWKIANQPLMNRHYWIELGGIDCQFEYFDKPIHDFMFRLQKDGGKIFVSRVHACIADWFPDWKADHRSVHDAQVLHDGAIFDSIYNHPNDREIRKEYDDWKRSPEVWARRFTKGVPNSYEELCRKEGYDMAGILWD